MAAEDLSCERSCVKIEIVNPPYRHSLHVHPGPTQSTQDLLLLLTEEALARMELQ